MAEKCGFPKPDGIACNTNVGDRWSDGFCMFHSSDPEAIEMRTAGRHKGAAASKDKAITTVEIPELDLTDIKSAEDMVIRVYNSLITAFQGMRLTAEVGRVLSDVAAKLDRAAERRHEALLQERIPFRIVWDGQSPTCQHCGELLADPPK